MMEECLAAVIFDLDGTIADNSAHHQMAWTELCRRHGLEITDEYYQTHIHASTNDAIIRTLFGEHVQRDEMRLLAGEKEEIYRTLYRGNVSEIAGFSRLLLELKAAGMPCGLASNAPRENVSLVLGELGVEAQFDCILCHGDVPRGKPDPAMFLVAAQRLAVKVEQCLVFEDSHFGFRAVRASGARCAAISVEPLDALQREFPCIIAVFPDFRSVTLAVLRKIWAFHAGVR